MCGIAGIIDLAGQRPAPADALRAMADAIFHRGPDEDGYLDRPGVGLASRRLSIVGLADGRQPISNENKDVWVVFNGELFDYPEKRAELEARGHKFATHTDTELIPHLWEESEERFFDHLKGQFAFALLDQRQNRLIVARDRFGICPVYWTVRRHGGDTFLLIGSEVKALLASGMVDAAPDVRGINHLFTFFATPGPFSCFAGIEQLLPGHWIDVRLNTGRAADVRPKPYWQLDFPDAGQEGPFADPKSVVDKFEEVLLGAVSRRLRADVPVVSYLSGGVDSSQVVAMACKVMGRPIPTFTIGINRQGLNEEREAALVARHVGCKSIVVGVGDREVVDTYPELIRAAEAPVIDTACAALLMLARRVREEGYKVALTGEGSDEWLAGYPWFKVHRILNKLNLGGLPISTWLRRAAMKLTGQPNIPAEAIRETEATLGGPNAWLEVYGLMSLSKYRFYSPWMREQTAKLRPFAELGLNLERMKKWHPLNRSLVLGGRVQLAGLLLASKGDRVAMNSSVEVRYPFLDEGVYDFLAGLHPNWKMRGLRDKYILRLLAERWLPKEIAWRRKAMFRAPMDSFHLGTGYADQLLSPESLRKTGYFDVTAVRDWRSRLSRLSAWSPSRTSVELGLAGVTATQLWHHTFVESSLCDLPSQVRGKPLAAVG